MSFISHILNSIKAYNPGKWDNATSDEIDSLQIGKDTKKSLYPAKILQSDRDMLYNRLGMVKKYIQKVSKDLLGNWHTLETNNETIRKILEEFVVNKHLVYKLTQAHQLAMKDGYSLIYLGFNDTQNIESPVNYTKASDIELIQVYPKSSCEIKRKHGKIDHYTISGFNKKDSRAKLKIHPSRILRWVHEEHPTHPEGVSQIDHNFNALMSYMNAIWGLGQTMVRYGSGYPILYMDSSIPQNQKENLSTWFQESHAWTSMVLEKDKFDVDFKGANGKALDPSPYVTALLDDITAGWNIPKTVLLGSQAGAVTGAEFNWKDYYSDLNSIQETIIAPRLFDLYNKVLQIHNIQAAEYEIRWEPQKEMEESRRAEMLKNFSSAAIGFMNSGFTANEVREMLGMRKLDDDYRLIQGQFIPVESDTKPDKTEVDTSQVENALSEEVKSLFTPSTKFANLIDEQTQEEIEQTVEDILREFEDL
jgi:phage-related protein (TIGR01555 family)